MDFNIFGDNSPNIFGNTPGTSSIVRQQAHVQSRQQPTTRFGTDPDWTQIGGEYWFSERQNRFGIGENRRSIQQVPAEVVIRRMERQTPQSSLRKNFEPLLRRYNEWHGSQLQMRSYEEAMSEAIYREPD